MPVSAAAEQSGHAKVAAVRWRQFRVRRGRKVVQIVLDRQRRPATARHGLVYERRSIGRRRRREQNFLIFVVGRR